MQEFKIGKSKKFERKTKCVINKFSKKSIIFQCSIHGFVILKNKPRRPVNQHACHQLPPCSSGCPAAPKAAKYDKPSLPMMAWLLSWHPPLDLV